MTRHTESVLALNRPLSVVLIVLLLGLGLAIRLYDLTDLPLDFHPTRQLLSQLKARGMYYQAHGDLPDWQRKMAVQQWRLRAEVEPEIFERLVAFTYGFTGPQTYVARVYSSLFWVAGGFLLFLLVRELASFDAAAVALAYFLFLPYGIAASRSFQPDVLMILLILAFWWTYLRWTRTQSWFWVILAALTGGLAILVKFVAAFFVLGAAIGLGLGTFGKGLLRKRQVWVMAAVGIVPTLIYLYYGLVQEGFLGRQFSGRFVPELLLQPVHYLRWIGMANLAAGGVMIALGGLGLVLDRDRPRRSMLIGLWIGYGLFGLFFDYHAATHDYYHLPLIPLVALSASPVLSLLSTQLAPLAAPLAARLAVLGLLLYASLAGIWDARGVMAATDYRSQVDMWAEIGDRLNHGPNVVALTQDYGSRLAYWGWQNSIVWPYAGDFEYRQVRGGELGFEEAFSKLTEGNTYFLITDFEELDRQSDLKDRLSTHEVFAAGEGYVIYYIENAAGS